MNASTVFVQSMVVDGDEIFPDFYRYLRKLYLGSYDPSTLGPGPDYPVALYSWPSKRGESQCGEMGGEGVVNLVNNNFSDLGTSDLGSNLIPRLARMNNLIHNVTTADLNTPPFGQTPNLR